MTITATVTELAAIITASLEAGMYAKAWKGKYQDRIYIKEGRVEFCSYTLYPEKKTAIRDGKTFWTYDSDGNFIMGTDQDFGATQLIEAGYQIKRGR